MEHPGKDALGDELVGWLERELDAAGSEPTKAALRRGVTDLGPEDERRFVERELAIWGSQELRERIRGLLEGRK